MENIFVLTDQQKDLLEKHLFPGDGKEAIAILLCGGYKGESKFKYLVHKIVKIPHEECLVRSENRVCWSTDVLKSVLEEAERKKLSVFKVHSHYESIDRFSEIDDESDKKIIPQIYSWIEADINHGSLVMLSNKKIIGRIVTQTGSFIEIDKFIIVGDDIDIYSNNKLRSDENEFAIRHRQAFGEKTFNDLKALTVAVVGCSGTGSFVVEMLARLGVGKLILVDPDEVEVKNLNRIVNSSYNDAEENKAKVYVFEEAIKRMGTGTSVKAFHENLFDYYVAKEVAEADVLFGCVDSIDGRHLLNRISNYYLIPYFDLGVKLKADGHGGVDNIVGAVNYLLPGKSTLLSRGLYTLEKLESANLMRTDPEEYKKRLKSKYIDGIDDDRPAVISINSQTASFAVNDFLARINPYRFDENKNYARTIFNFCDWSLLIENELDFKQENIFQSFVGRGDIVPFLNMPSLSTK